MLKRISQEINNKIIRELRSIAKDKGLHGYYRLKKADLVVLLLEQSTKEMPTPLPRGSREDDPKPSRNG